MASEWCMTHSVIEATETVTMVLSEVEYPTESRRPVHIPPRTSWPTLRQPIFDWKVQYE